MHYQWKRANSRVPLYTRTVSEWTKDNTVSFSLRDMTRRFRDCLGR